MSSTRRFLTIAAFEGGLCLVAAVLGRWTGFSPWPGLRSHFLGVVAALGLTAILFGGFTWIYANPVGPFRRIRELLNDKAGPLFADMSWRRLAVVAALAGFGEEAIFRGWLQGWAESLWGAVPAACLSAAAFGLAHPLSFAYAVITALIGLTLAGLYHYSGGWLAPAITHGLYDFLALAWLFKKFH